MKAAKLGSWQGNTIPRAAEKLGMGESQVRRAVDRGEIKVVTFAGLNRIPNSEISGSPSFSKWMQPRRPTKKVARHDPFLR